MSRNLTLPFFAVPPGEYRQQYFAELVRSFTVYLAQQQNPGQGRNTELVLTNGDNDMSDTIITMRDGSKWKPSTSSDTVHCVNCENAVDTPEEIASYPDGNCPDCGQAWTGSEKRSTSISVTAPEAISGEA